MYVPVSSTETASPLSQSFLLAPRPLPLRKVQSLSPAALAYLGDAVYELYIRQALLLPPQRIDTYHHRVVAQVRAEAQANYLQQLAPHLTEVEWDWVRRGRNAASSRHKRVDAQIYQQATGFEALIGYLYLAQPDRLEVLLSYLNGSSEGVLSAPHD
ncbi:ribonuclease III [Alkalinema sp. FACHB-956]|nr:ribonuclease III [Alkalinema sp. FACHB-956]